MRMILLAGAAVLATITPAAAQAPGSRPTRDFVAAAGQSDAYEMLAADDALAQSADPQVQAFARMMLHDHGQTSEAMQHAAASAGLEPPPTSPGSDQAALLAALQGLRGKDFDKAYWHQQALAHRSTLVVVQTYATNGDTPAVKQAAAAALPMIRMHLQTAEQMAAQSGS